ncbi:LacI family transcriptional regulator [Lentzea pudingi]|uniref:LacI family transcriptional regulator n=1 Tax=Lentzea pudingi TaxID=1789439 RepID=A0ABQ2IRY8_9PSEU|nr:LacI family DNA-binding transcriptional regulator [Lentzea pudingi]GGN28523.1 LacI family transcriptional regulator [Lentzea pudingi]
MATMREVAGRAGVSTATVSRALSGNPTVDPDLAARVRSAAHALGYRPNGVARSLRRQTTAVLALIISDVENPFFTAIARGVEDTAQSAGYSVVLCNSDESTAKERRYVDVLLQEQVAGVIVSPTSAAGALEPLWDNGTPVVAVDRPLPGLECDTVLVDSRVAANVATTHLAAQGYQRIGCLTGPVGVHTADDRLAGYRDALRAAKRRSAADLVRRAEFRTVGAKRSAADLFGIAEPPDGLLVANSTMATGTLEAMSELGLRAGRDVGLVAFDDSPWATLVDPPLTVISQPAYQIGTMAAQLLLARIGGDARAPRTITLNAQLVVRGSSHR